MVRSCLHGFFACANHHHCVHRLKYVSTNHDPFGELGEMQQCSKLTEGSRIFTLLSGRFPLVNRVHPPCKSATPANFYLRILTSASHLTAVNDTPRPTPCADDVVTGRSTGSTRVSRHDEVGHIAAVEIREGIAAGTADD